LAQQIRKKGVSPREVINAVLARMEKLEPILHASVYGSCLAGSGEAEVRTARP
jgi:Asp-tRNA(Asn)/Glu-tRNA(Gln) amidotransferase A subunit family amidase